MSGISKKTIEELRNYVNEGIELGLRGFEWTVEEARDELLEVERQLKEGTYKGVGELKHVKYLSIKRDLTRSLYYIGGEDNQNLTIGKKYEIHKASYAEKEGDPRVEMWICLDDLDKPHRLMTNEWGNQILNFVDLTGLRDYKLNKLELN